MKLLQSVDGHASRVRSDKGGENIEVARAMLSKQEEKVTSLHGSIVFIINR